jgi:hypothetical protein
MSKQFYKDRLQATQKLIVAYEDAIQYLMENPQSEYSLDTGQTVQKVKYHNIADLQNYLEPLYARHQRLDAICNGKPKVIAPLC